MLTRFNQSLSAFLKSGKQTLRRLVSPLAFQAAFVALNLQGLLCRCSDQTMPPSHHCPLLEEFLIPFQALLQGRSNPREWLNLQADWRHSSSKVAIVKP